ncbi:MAG: DUF58 domain-containing protein [Planctomycetota bacterium]
MADAQPTPTEAQAAADRSTDRAADRAVDATLYLHPSTLSRLGTLELRAKMIVEGVMSGAHRSPYQGISVEFAQHRQYVAGDDLRHLDWKVYGRSDKLYLKQYQQETNLDLVVLVDASGSMAYGSRLFSDAAASGESTGPTGSTIWRKYDHATALAAALSYITLQQGDRVGLFTFADSVLTAVARSSSQGSWRRIVQALSQTPVDRPTELGRVVDQVLGKLNNRCLLVVISDFFADLETLRAACARVKHRGHDLIAFQVLDREETEFDFKDAAPFDGLEGEERLRIDPRAIRSAYLEALGQHNAAVEKGVRRVGFDYHSLGTHDWLGPPLAHFVARRQALLKRSKLG